MAKRMNSKTILDGIQQLVDQASITGERLNGAMIARRIGCSRTTLYTNSEVRDFLLAAGIIDETPVAKSAAIAPSEPKKDFGILERRLQRAEERASRLELLLSEAQEKVRVYEAEIQRLRLRNQLLSEGKSII